ncbi:TPA: hypothetical protein QCI16_003085 [Enterobacter ludwigii]|uniref:hypothetical protein n=1 Tax=Enterobacter sp. 200527-13 TaxID=2995131 RepID=UPI0022BB8EED|nr:hypothetical protein [Enterobacter sp. 200527-13]GLH24120.1 hypothetical protein ENT52713_15160 [Enterobacter sp. 200527-13]HDR2588939.1 hypothetical protein [Enterobacter ludwigii]HDR2598907.1 hypothetical protein [Enterobacter ludwigii]
MKVVKYWKVELFRDNDRRSGITGMISPTSPFFTGYSREKPALNLQSDVQPGEYIELYAAPDALESRLFRRHSFDYIHLTPIFESGEKCCDDDEHVKVDHDSPLVPPAFEDIVFPLMRWLAENRTPDHMVVVSDSRASLLEGKEWLTKE